MSIATAVRRIGKKELQYRFLGRLAWGVCITATIGFERRAKQNRAHLFSLRLARGVSMTTQIGGTTGLTMSRTWTTKKCLRHLFQFALHQARRCKAKLPGLDPHGWWEAGQESDCHPHPFSGRGPGQEIRQAREDAFFALPGSRWRRRSPEKYDWHLCARCAARVCSSEFLCESWSLQGDVWENEMSLLLSPPQRES